MPRSATPLLLLPDAGHDARSWPAAFLEAVGPVPLLRPDWPGLPGGSTDLSVAGLAAAVRAGVDAELRPRGARVHVLGQGLGALVALELALGRRKLVASLALIGAHSGARTAVAPPPWVSTALAEALARPDGAQPGEVQAGALRSLLHAREFSGASAPLLPAATVRAHWAAAASADSYARLPRIDRPTLLLHGSADVVVLPENGRTLAGRIGSADFRLIDGAGHLLVQERPRLVAALVRDFLSGLA